MNARDKKKTSKTPDPMDTKALEPKAETKKTPAKQPKKRDRAELVNGDVLKATDEILTHYPLEEPSLIMVLQEINDHFRWLPQEALDRVAEKLEVPVARVQGVATFYKVFSLEPKGKKTIKVCAGTACHVRGAGMLVDELKRELKVEVGSGVSPDGSYSLETVNCVGACAMAPVVVVEDNYYANMTPGNVEKMVKKERPS